MPFMSAPVAVVHDARDVALLLKQKMKLKAILALSPTARAALLDERLEIPIWTSRRTFTDEAYAAAMVRIRAGRDAASARLCQAGVGPAARWIFLYGYQAIANAACRLSLTLGEDGPWLVPDEGGFVVAQDKTEAQARILRHLLARFSFVSGWHAYAPPPLPEVYRWLRRIAARLVRKRGPAIVTQRVSHPFGLDEFLATYDVRQYHVTRTEQGWKEYARLPLEFFRAWQGRGLIQFRAVSTLRFDAKPIDEAIAAIEDSTIREAAGLVRDDFVKTAQLIGGMVEDMRAIVDALKPQVFLAYELADGFTAALAEASGMAGVPRLIMNHNSHTPTATHADDLAMEHFFTTQYTAELTDEFLLWTPLAADVARQYLPSDKQAHVRPILRTPEVAGGSERAHRHGGGERRVLHAGNSQRWLTFFPWVFETSDEFFDGVTELILAMGRVPNSRLVVRTKGKAEQDEKSLRALLPSGAFWDLKTRSDSAFGDDLAEADVLVCDMSSTIMQALHARIPVLLWGGTQRYRHLPARTQPPTAMDRGSIYTVDRASDLAPMISAILDVHAGKPLTDAEIEPYIWPGQPPGMDALARAIAGGDYRSAWN